MKRRSIQSFQQARFLCDYYHVSEYLAKAAETCRPQAPAHWRKTQQKRLKRGAVNQILDALTEHLDRKRLPKKRRR